MSVCVKKKFSCAFFSAKLFAVHHCGGKSALIANLTALLSHDPHLLPKF